MQPTQSLIQHKALQDNIEQFKLCPTRVAMVQEADTPTEWPQALLALLEVELHNRHVSITQGHYANPPTTRPDGATLLEVSTQSGHPDPRQRMFDALMTSPLLVQDRSAYAGQACPDDGQSDPMYSGRPVIHYLVRTGRHHLEGGLRHVPAISGLAHSQAPPIPQAGDTGNRSQHT